MNNALQTFDLHHRFGSHDVLRGVDMMVPEGSIYGFLGPNGAGKTTTLRALLGLLKPRRGEIVVFGQPLERARLSILARVGSMIETPSIYDHLTAEENLRVLQVVRHCDRRRIVDVLDLVGLGATGKKRAKHFSLGMRQRLGLAAALLHEPDLLILDEPTNGLDPNGIIEMRDLLIHLHRTRGITIIVSSHLLAEVDRLATHVGVLGRGTLRFQGTLGELRRNRQEIVSLRLATSDNAAAAALLRTRGLDASVSDGEIVLPPLPPHDVAMLNRALLDGNVDVYEIRNVRNDLESMFLDLLKEPA